MGPDEEGQEGQQESQYFITYKSQGEHRMYRIGQGTKVFLASST